MAARSGDQVRLRGQQGRLRIFNGEPPRGARGRRLLAMQLRDALRDEVLNGVGAYHAMWCDIYEWIGPPLRLPPRRATCRDGADLVEAFERGLLLAFHRPLYTLQSESPAAARKAARAADRGGAEDDVVLPARRR